MMEKTMKKFLLIPLLFLAVGCTALDKKATMDNYYNVVKITAENDTYIDGSGLEDIVKKIKKDRNAEARDLAEQLAKEAGNEFDEPADPTDPADTN